jgi:hypothetical protein
MAQVVPFEAPENYRRVERRIKTLWESGHTEISVHAQERMKLRNLDMPDVQNVIRYGRVVDHSKPANLWRYVIEGKSVDGKKTSVVVEINGALTIVTVMRRAEGGRSQ